MGTPDGRFTLTQLVEAVRDKAGMVHGTLSPELPDGQNSPLTGAPQNWSIRTMCNKYVQGLRRRVKHRLQQEGLGAATGLRLYFNFWITRDADATVSGSTVWLPADCDLPIRLIDTTTNREIPIVNDPGPYRYASGPAKVAVRAGHQVRGSDSTTALNHKLLLYPSDVAPTLTVDMYRLPAAMNESDPDNTYPDLPAELNEVIVFGVAADIVQPTGPSSTAEMLRREENRLFQAMIREGEWL